MNKPKSPCRHPGCYTLTSQTYCEIHKALHQRSVIHQGQTGQRESAAKRGYGRTWRQERTQYLIDHPWCVICMRSGRHEPATEVDHVIPHKGDKKLFWDRKNWQALCHRCHSEKTAREDGGFGRAPQGKKVSD